MASGLTKDEDGSLREIALCLDLTLRLPREKMQSRTPLLTVFIAFL